MLKVNSQTSAKQIRNKVSQWIRIEVNGVSFRVTSFKEKNKVNTLIDAPRNVKITFEDKEYRGKKS